ncbi:MAG: ribulokinase [Tannerellaceae bacterium]|jgi:L-ribulokinase|nr:ribulokinase [Tannerellaceae bacterium]
MDDKFVIGLDYGTDSCRAVVANAFTGEEIASAVSYYPRWQAGRYCDEKENRYRQHPLDYTEALTDCVREALQACPRGTAAKVAGMAFDTTGSTPVLTDREGTPLALLPGFEENPNAMFVLWKDHTAIREAAEINALARRWETDYTAYEGGVYSSEWVWAKMAHVLRADESVRRAAYAWIEHCDWMPALLTGNTKPEAVYRSRCAAGHKAMWHEKWGGLPSEAFLAAVEPLLAGFRSHLYEQTYTSDTRVGYLTEEWASRLGLHTGVAVAAGAFDCHIGAVGAGIRPHTFVRVIGTSTCDIMAVSYDEIGDRLIPGICGQVDGSVIPGMTGLEAGQSGFGDIYAWFKRVLMWPVETILAQSPLAGKEVKDKLIREISNGIIPLLSEEAAKVPVSESAVLAVDWMNGRRTPDANQLVKGTIAGLNLGSSAPLIFRALVEATAYGSKAIVDRFLSAGMRIDSVTGIGGIALKSPFVMQVMADVLGMPVKVGKSEQACAFGASMFAAVAAGIYTNVEEAQQKMGQGFAKEYTPHPGNHQAYRLLYEKYSRLGAFTEHEL